MTFLQVVGLTGATRNQLTHWANHYLARPKSGTGHHYDFSADDVALIAEAVKATRVWGPSAARAVFREGARVATATSPRLSDCEEMAIYELRTGRAKLVPVK